MRYNYYTYSRPNSDNKLCPHVACTSTFAGKTVRGVAICSENDHYDFELGKELARMRCDVKVSEKRVKKANSNLEAALEALAAAQEQVARMEDYVDDAVTAHKINCEKLEVMEAKLR